MVGGAVGCVGTLVAGSVGAVGAVPSVGRGSRILPATESGGAVLAGGVTVANGAVLGEVGAGVVPRGGRWRGVEVAVTGGSLLGLAVGGIVGASFPAARVGLAVGSRVVVGVAGDASRGAVAGGAGDGSGVCGKDVGVTVAGNGRMVVGDGVGRLFGSSTAGARTTETVMAATRALYRRITATDARGFYRHDGYFL